MIQEIIKVKVSSMNFMWGYYNITSYPTYEDITILRMIEGKYTKCAKLCVCSKLYVQNLLDALIDDSNDDDNDFIEKIRGVLSKNEISYHYEYDRLEDKDLYQVPYEAQRNSYGIKPCYVELWHTSELVSVESLESGVQQFCNVFLGITDCKIEVIIDSSKKEAIKEYMQHIELGVSFENLTFSEEVLEQLETTLGLTRDGVLKTLERSLK